MSEPKTEQQTAVPTPGEKIATSKRRLLNAGLASAPLYLTLKSVPVLATTNCKNPSGFSVSGQASRPQDFAPCSFSGPSIWGSNSDWGSLNSLKNQKIKDTLGNVSSRSAYANVKLKNAFSGQPDAVRYLCAAYLNSRASSGTFPVTTAQVQEMWADGSSANYNPAPTYSTTWGDAEILEYLKYLMTP
jgi:hypothetical protein